MRSFEVIPRVTLCNDKLTYQAYIHTYIPNYLMYRSYLLDNLTGARNQSTPLTYIILLQADGLPPPPPPPFPSSPTSFSHPLCLKPVAGCFCRYVVLRYGDRRIAGTAAGWLS